VIFHFIQLLQRFDAGRQSESLLLLKEQAATEADEIEPALNAAGHFADIRPRVSTKVLVKG